MKKLTLVLLVIASLILGAFTMASCEMPTEIAGIAIPEIEVPELKKIELPFELPFEVPFVGCNHEFVEETKAATCTEDGVLTKTCSKCGEVVEEVIPALGHDFSDKYTIDVPATCAAEGSKSKHCSRCDAKDGVKVVDKLDHIWASNMTEDKPVTCTVDGQKSIHCEECGAIKEDSIEPIVAGGHVFDLFFTTDIEKTCTTAGWESKHCSACDETSEGREIPASHEWAEEYTLDFAETCNTNGQKSKHCKNCSEVSEPVVIKAHHTFGDVYTVVPSTIYATGKKSGNCCVQGCGIFFEETLTSTIGLVDAKLTSFTIGSAEGKNGHWTYTKSVSDVAGQKNLKYYPTEGNPYGNDLVMEASILVNDTMTAKNGYGIFRIQNSANGNKTDLVWIDGIGDDDANYPALAYTAAYKKEDKQPYVALTEGWHRIGGILHQEVVTTMNGEIIESIAYKWTFKVYLDGTLVFTMPFTKMASGNNKEGIWDATNLLYTATISEDGKSLEYQDGIADSMAHIRFEDVLKDGKTTLIPVADCSITCGTSFVQEVVPVTYDLNGGSVCKTYSVEGTDKKYADICYFQVVGGANTPKPTLEKANCTLDHWDGNKAVWVADANHTVHIPVGEKTVVYAASIFAAGKQTFTCEGCGLEIEEEIAKLTPTVFSSNSDKSGQLSVFYKNTADYIDLSNDVTALDEFTLDFMFEFSFLQNESLEGRSGLGGLIFELQAKPTGSSSTSKATVLQIDAHNAEPWFRDFSSGAPDVFIVDGWHRFGVQIRQSAKVVDDAVVYEKKARFYLDGVLLNDAGTWAIANAGKWSNFFFFKAEKNAQDATKIDVSALDYSLNLSSTMSGFYNLDNAILPLTDFEFSSKRAASADAEIAYADLFVTNVTPLGGVVFANDYQAGALVVNLDGGTLPTATLTATNKAGAKDYTVPGYSFFQIVGAAAIDGPVPVREGYTFAGWVKSGKTFTATWTPVTPAQ